MDNDADKKDSDNVLTPLEICIFWGREHLLKNTIYPQEQWVNLLAGSVSETYTGNSELFEILKEELEKFSKKVVAALDYLNSDESVGYDDQDYFELWIDCCKERTEYENLSAQKKKCIDILDSFTTLDSLVYLYDAVNNVEQLKELLSKNQTLDFFKTRLDDLLEKATLEKRPFNWRFIPLNEIRRTRLESIPEPDRYLFPWYQDFSNVPAVALHIVAEVLAGSRAFVCNDLPEGISAEDLNLLCHEVEYDEPLKVKILEESAFLKALPQAIEKSYSLRWAIAMREEAAARVVPEEVVEAGIYDAAVRVIAKDILNPEMPQSVWRFRAAACAPYISDSLRMKIYEEFEDHLKESELDSSQPGATDLTDFGGLTEIFKQWLNPDSEMDDIKLAEDIFAGWQEDLSKVTAEGFSADVSPETIDLSPDDENSEELEDRSIVTPETIDLLLTHENPEELAESILKDDAIGDCVIASGTGYSVEFSDIPTCYYSTGYLICRSEIAAGPNTSRETNSFEITENPIRLPLPVPDENIYGEQEYKLLNEAPESILNLKTFLDGSIFVFGGKILFADKEESYLEIAQGYTSADVKIECDDGKSVKAVILGISGDQDLLSNALEIMRSGETDNTIENPESGIIWLIFSKQNKED